MTDSTTHRCLFKGCPRPPTTMIESDVGLEGNLALYFCAEHAEAFQKGQTEEFDIDRSEAEGAALPES